MSWEALKAWIAANEPELDAELAPLTMEQVRRRLNYLTGCTVQPSDSVRDGSARYLAVLRRHGPRPKNAWPGPPNRYGWKGPYQPDYAGSYGGYIKEEPKLPKRPWYARFLQFITRRAP